MKNEEAECLVSIVTPTYNTGSLLRDIYRNLNFQSVKDWEWIVVDDGSDIGDENDFLALIRGDHRVIWHKFEFNRGAAQARNKALSLARGKYIAFLDSDDLWDHKKLENQLNFMGDEIEFSFTGFRVVDYETGSTKKYIDCKSSMIVTYSDLLKKKVTLGCSTVVISKRLIGANVMPDLKRGQDYAFWLLCLRGGNQAHLLPEPLTDYRIRSDSLSRNKLKKAISQWNIYRKVEKITFSKSVYYFVNYALRAVLR